LRVEDLRVQFRTPRGVVRAVDGVSFTLQPGERFGLVGESGSGKSTIALALMRLIKPPGQIVGGRMLLGDIDLATLPESAMRSVRMARIALIPQGAMNSLNPVMRIRQQMLDGILAHRAAWDTGNGGKGDGRHTRREWEERIGDLLESVGLRREVADRYPHELSGGMKQRVCIAIAIALRPSIIIADEPTSALDVVVQRQIMQTLGAVQARLGAAVLLIGHDMGLMAQFVDRIGVTYGGKLLETGPTREVFAEPLHPYTQVLIRSLPSFEHEATFVKIAGQPHSPLNPPSGCVFHPRCPRAFDACPVRVPPLREVRPGRFVACHLYEGIEHP
jgi:peptide/nickel transport system ATP-binding protein